MFPTLFFKSIFEIIKRKEWIEIVKLCLHFCISIFAVIAVCITCMDIAEGKLNGSGFQFIAMGDTLAHCTSKRPLGMWHSCFCV
jgi:hypothetical protein